MEWENVTQMTSIKDIPQENFWSGIKVWVERPHILNTKVLAAEVLDSWKKTKINDDLCKSLQNRDFCFESLKRFKGAEEFQNDHNDNQCAFNDNPGQSVIVRKQHPKHFKFFHEVMDVVVLDFTERVASFYPKKDEVLKSPIIPAFSYRLKLTDNNRILLDILRLPNEEPNSEALKWLTTKVMPKIVKWSQEVPKVPAVSSLSLVSAKEYNTNLSYLKSKYGKKFVELWPNYNATNPQKFVYEDISIAAYLITLWAEERRSLSLTELQTYIDLGCGNGFLDHILSSEGHKGLGIDLRKRRIWEVYGPETNLVEGVVQPNDKQLYPEYDWIIGNHADELTPWIPIIAARSSYNMRVFLLPCCFYTFDGKFIRPKSKLPQYQSYLTFLEELCTTAGFKVKVDRLRIPSTKRTCLVCTSRTYKKEDEAELNEMRDAFIQVFSNKKTSYWKDSEYGQECCDPESPLDNISCIVDFLPREPVEKVRNCSNLHPKLKLDIVTTIFEYLLSIENYCNIRTSDSIFLWNKGGCLKVKDVHKLLSVEMLKGLKLQRGGLQTLIKNHGYIFQIESNSVRIKLPTKLPTQISSILRQENKYKRKKCFFHAHHPQGCPLKAENCTFIH